MNEKILIEHLRKVHSKHDTSNFNILDFMSAFGSPLDGLVYSRLFWPEFIEFKEMIFLKESIEDEDDKRKIAETFKRYGGDKTKTEQSFNLIEIPSGFFTRGLGDTTEEEDRWLAEKLAEMWLCRLQFLYPNRKFEVKVLNPEETGGEVGVIFYQLGL
jgi:hypothetical protein